ncbi:Bcr/CflA subfamily drug resistance transporter [Rubricella aquisinus]|uniref:Bcr/CflA family efflux transporter n=1 Tax=Rubricella aquisinus TaxID=2028108 RepID=A0A840WXF1_9RHOB|nr:multidrug effflux MFS transporter [Rubricella aquisinus]MBB5515034.1 Bcr/CflA subfamily drug resistance transporter [Rubricella aquisinus]
MIGPAHSPPHLFTLVLLTGVSILSLNMFLPSLPQMAAEFEVSYALMAVSVGGYLGLTAVLQIIMGPMSDRFGRRPLLLTGLGVFTLASIGCVLAQDIWTFLLCRMMQGTVIACASVTRAVVRDTHTTREAASKIGYISMAMAAAPMLGPSVGGVMDEFFGWRSVFVLFSLLGLACFLLTYFDLGETNKNPSPTIRQQFRAYPELIRSEAFWAYAICMSFSVGAFYVFQSGAPLVAAAVFDLSPSLLGVAIGSITLGFFFGTFLSGRIASKVRLSTMMIAGRISATSGMVIALALLGLGFESVWTYFTPVLLVGFGNGLTLPSAGAGALSVRPDLAGGASGLSGAMMVAIGGVLTSLAAAALTPEQAAPMLLWIMLAVILIAFAAAWRARKYDDLIDR